MLRTFTVTSDHCSSSSPPRWKQRFLPSGISNILITLPGQMIRHEINPGMTSPDIGGGRGVVMELEHIEFQEKGERYAG